DVVMVVLLAVHVGNGITEMAHSARALPDFVRYYEIATTPGRPYLDYQVEHPPGTLLVFKTLAAITHDRHGFAFDLVALTLCADRGIIGTLWTVWGARAAAFYLFATWPMLAIVYNRVDLLSTSCATVAIAAWRQRRPAASGVAFALGTSFKLWPLPLS